MSLPAIQEVHFQSCGDATKRIGLKCNQLHFLASKYYWHKLKFIILQNCGSLAATASTPRAELCGSGDRLRGQTAVGTTAGVERWQQGVNCSQKLVQPAATAAAAAAAAGRHGRKRLFAAVEVCDRGAAGGESRRGSRPGRRPRGRRW